jgi:hypothetical protein
VGVAVGVGAWRLLAGWQDGLVVVWVRAPLPITLVAGKYKQPAKGYKGKNSLEPLKGSRTKPYWATPRAHMTGAAQIMTERTSHDLPTQVRHERDTPDAERHCLVAPEFVEFLMVYRFTGLTLHCRATFSAMGSSQRLPYG